MKKFILTLAIIASTSAAFSAVSQGVVVRATDGYSLRQTLTNPITWNLAMNGSSNYVGGSVFFGGTSVPRYTNGFIVFDSIEHYFGDYILFNGGEFIGVHRGDGQYLSNVPPAAIQQSGASSGDVLKWDGAQWAPGADSGGGLSVGDWATLTNNLVRQWNIRDYGAVGNNLAADSVGLAHAASNAFRFGGVVYMPRSSPNAAYIFTNRLSVPNISTNGTETRYSDIAFLGDGMGATQIKLALTNAVWLSCVGNAPVLKNFSITYAGSGTNTVLENINAAYGTAIERVGAYNFTNSEVFRLSALMGTRIKETDFEHGAVGIRLLRYMDGTEIDTRGSYMTIAPVVIGGYNPTYPELANATGVRVKLNGTVNTYGVIVAGGSRGAEISGYQERPARGAVSLGYPLDLFPGETNNTIAQVSIKNLYCPVNYSNSAPFVSVETTVQDLHLNGVFGGDLIVVTNQTVANALRIHFSNHQCANSEVRWPTANVNIPSSPYSDQNINRSYKQWSYSNGTTNLVVSLDTSGARINAQVGINSDATLAPLTVKLSSLNESWLQVMANVGTASAAKTMRVGMHAYDGGTEVQTVMFGNIPSAGSATLNFGGGTSVGNPFSVLDFYVGGNPAIAYAGTNMFRIDTSGVTIPATALVFHSLAQSNHITGPARWAGTVTADTLYGNGINLTNVHEKNIAVTTNSWGNAAVDFTRGTMLITNLAGNLTLTGPTGFVSSNLNWQTIALNPDGATRVITVPEDWWVSGAFTNQTTAALTNGTVGTLRIEALIGIRTNAALEISQ